MSNKLTRLPVLVLSLIVVVFFIGFSSAYNCWDYDDDQTACDANYDCVYHSESWGGWCEELNCWSLWSQTDCTNTTLTAAIGKNCQWKSSNDFGWCGQTSCGSFKNTNETYCEDSSANGGLNCEWSDYCTGWNEQTNCWGLTTSATCGNVSGCSWGECMDTGCWNYDSTDCTSNNGSRGQSCLWNSDNSYCYEPSCWDYGGLSSNETYCEDSESRGMTCNWIDDAYHQNECVEPSCWIYDYTDSNSCTNTSLNGNLTCTWDGQYCMMGGCWSYSSSGDCSAASGCNWETGSGSGWCEEIQCWSWDGWNGGNQTDCESNAYNLSCAWGGSTPTDSNGGCYTNMTAGECSGFTSNTDCMNTYYCWWNWNDWTDTSLGGTCSTPDWGEIGQDDIFNEWNPGCYIFDMNSTDCNNIIGCNYTGTTCGSIDQNSSFVNVTAAYINENGLNCSMINNTQMCNNIPALSTCCEWGANGCVSKLGSSCWENADMEQQGLGVVACEDVSMQTSTAGEGESLCQQIAVYPLYMPCAWDNTTNICSFKSDNVFGNRTQSFALVDNKKNCEAANGKWIQEFYCEGNRSIPAGRCEQKGSDEKNCDKACFACEYQFTGAVHNSSRTAKEYCYDSKLGYCEFIVDSSAPNGFGLCRAKSEFTSGTASDCKSNCGSCTYFGDPNAASYSDARPDLNPPIQTSYDICNTPECYCEYAKEFNNVACKWVSDASSTDIGGYCVDSSEKTCADSCDRCYTQDNCLDNGRSSLNGTGSCEWTQSGNDYICTKRTGSDGVTEVCWDGVDNDGDNLIDCGDSNCYADSFCGFVSGDCFGWITQANCEAAQLASGLNCSWVSDAWGSWCDFPGMDCWQSDGNQTLCNAKNLSCDWSGGNVANSGWCEQDWNVGGDCYSLMNEVNCGASEANCTWTNDTWCAGEGADNTWCTEQGGWCDPAGFAPKNCWTADNTNSTYCESIDPSCYYDDDGDWCMEQGCWNYDGNESGCDITSGCNWETNDWGSMCEVDWSANCWQFDVDTCGVGNDCAWRTGNGWTGCDNKFMACMDYSTSIACGLHSDTCYWDSWMWNWQTNTQGMCNGICFDPDISDSTCGETSGCRLSTGWCMSDSAGGSTGGLDCWQYDSNDTECGETSGCRWKSEGWCNPKGFTGGGASTGAGGGASTGMDCWKYDGNETLCEDSSSTNISCVWMPEFRPFCEPDWTSDCWKYYDNETADENGYVCGNATGCMWNNNSQYCMNAFDECWNNGAYSNDTEGNESSVSAIACNANANCNWTDGSWDAYYTGPGWCEPNCFGASTEATCTGSCRWMDGWCNTPGMYGMFGGMEMGAPMIVVMDAMGDSTDGEEYTDLVGIGIKDMGESYGFGSGTTNFADAGICNNEKIGFGGGNNFGNGNATVKYYVYLDTDGSATGGCALRDNSSAMGYDFFFTYRSSYNVTLGKAVEVFNAKKCGSSGWTTSDISLSTWKEKMCGEIQGPMIAIDKAALEKFPTLYDSGADMRIYVAMAGANNNASSPSDSAGPGWVSPSSIDFPITGFFELGASSAIFEDILMGGGFVTGEDCYNLVDDNNDGLVDCADWDCQFAPHCVSSGVNAAGYVDTSMPAITGIKIEEYPDAALVMFDTDKPSNATLTFYGNDSTCTTLNDTVYDSTILSSVRNYTSWHYTSIYNDTGLNSLDYPLSNDTIYYYKLKVCDSGGRCGTSACSSFRTAESSAKCGYCNFVTIISPPTGWTVYYDLNTNGTYEHIQGQMCGPQAGMKTSYSEGRKANVKMTSSDGAELIFLNATVTKTGLTGNTRKFSTAGDLIHDASLTDSSGGAIEMVGMISSTRDKVVNNLHPEICQIKIPNDDCTELWHCDNDGDNCDRRDNDAVDPATGVADGTSCLWTIPYCEFSTWATGEPGTVAGDDTPSSGGGGGGGGGGAVADEEEDEGDGEDGEEGGPQQSPPVEDQVGLGDDETGESGRIGSNSKLLWWAVGIFMGLAGIALGFYIVKRVRS
ncbi:MAG: hypothetical protein ABH864_06225 [archaeon]